MAEAPIPADADTVALVADNTASDAGGGLPPAIEESLREAQRNGQILVIVPVEGDGANPAVQHRIALDPYTGEDSPRADRARGIVISCVERWVRAPESQPNSPGSDILAAIGAAAREQPTTILVISDGLGTAGGLDVNRHGFDVDPAQLARDAQDAAEPQLRETSIVWAGLGNSTTQLPQALRNSLRTLWTALLTEAGAEVTFDDRSGAPAPPADELPEDPVTVPAPVLTPVGCATKVTLPTSLLFQPGSAQIGAGTDGELGATAAQLIEHPDWTAEVSGHTAHYGSEEYRRELSIRRARAVVEALVEMGVDRRRLTAVGAGSDDPEVDEFPGGVHDESAAAVNRRVVVELLPAGCDR